MGADARLERLFEDASRIPAAPGVALELARLCGQPETSIDHLVELLRCDPTLTAKVLRMANSAYFAAQRQISELQKAVVRLGLRRVQIMSLAFCIIEATMPSEDDARVFDYNYFWSHALVTGTFADVLCRKLGEPMPVEPMVTGLLQDVGVLVIQTALPDQYRGVLEYHQQAGGTLTDAEKRRLGFDHTEAGAALLERWNLPEAACAAIAHHHHPETAEDPKARRLAEVCHLGSLVAKYVTDRDNWKSALNAALEIARDRFGLDADRFEALLGAVRMKLDASAEMLEVRMDQTMVSRLDAAIRDRIAECALQAGMPDQA